MLTHERSTLAAREPAFCELTNAWMARFRAAPERRFDPDTARMVDALIEGFTIHQALDTETHSLAIVAETLRRIISATG